MKHKIAALCCYLACQITLANPLNTQETKVLNEQIVHLTELLKDHQAQSYPQATMSVRAKNAQGEDFVLAVFTIEGFGGGNNFTQYLAAFSPEKADNGKLRLTLLDVISIGGRGGRTINQLKPAITFNKTATHIALPALEVTENDAPNFPSKKIMIQFILKNGRLLELAEHRKAAQK